ncbi:MAG: glycine--tRNA ligase [Candidatus Lokiarchaeota archaeon]|nr:glycine--tRNA ligase [Candidatus Lokiarchaeota archaeon]MBD3199781.1 glycine--tRNA ligase [Candidatus Lokiarchaeota archaeon]
MKIEDNIETFNSLIKRSGWIWGPSPEIYGGLAGFYSYGPAGMALKNNILSIFRKELRSFGFGEVECPTVMPEIVWEASGHLERFIDPILKCKKCGSVYRADKFLKDKLPDMMIDGLSFEKMEQLIKENNLMCPECESDFGKIEEYNLMLKTKVGTDSTAFLRPETATTTYLLFNRLDQVMRRQYPLKVFQFGKAYRNEISPRQGVLRMRSFDQFELQLFISKEQEMNFDEFEDVKESKLPLLDWRLQEKNIDIPKLTSLEEAIDNKILKKPAYAYCLYIGYYLIKKLGYPENVVRFRQHSPNERAHYADDAWDLEVETEQYGWVEICGIHDRTDYDLRRHGEHSGQNFEIAMGSDPKNKEIPQILEIAYGIDRIIYTLLETNFNVEDGRINMELNTFLAPNTVAVFPLVRNKEEITNLAKKINSELQDNLISSFYDESGSIGKRYRRQDELGTPFCITIDYDSLEDQEVTIRDRDSMEQDRVPISEITNIIQERLIKSKL